MTTPTGTLLRGGTVYVMDDATSVHPADVRLRGERIVEVAANLKPQSDELLIDVSGCVVLPGFVQTHVHLCQTLFRNLADDLLLLDWLAQRIWPLEAAHTAASLRASAELGIAELFLGGSTAIVDMGTVHHTDQIFEALAASGMRAIAGKCMMDASDQPQGLREHSDDSIRQSIDLAERWDGACDGRLRYGFAPRFALSCTEGLMREVAAEARERGLWVHTHASENTDEVAMVLERSGGVPNVAFLAQLGISGPQTILAHCVHLESAEVAELAASGTRVAHCPSSNLKLGSGIAAVPDLLAAGVHVSLGADGAPCNNCLDQFIEMRTAALIQKPRYGPTAMPADQVLRLATRSGAEALGLGEDLGQIRAGFLADLQVLQLDDLCTGPAGSLASRIVYAANRSAVRHVFVGGRRVVADGRLTTLDRERVSAHAKRAVNGCLERAGFKA